jgi:6-phosphofructokinase 1
MSCCNGYSGCQTYIIREGWEGLVRGNTASETPQSLPPTRNVTPSRTPPLTRNSSFAALPPSQKLSRTETNKAGDEEAKHVDLSDTPLSFGFGELLKYGAGEGDEDEDPYATPDSPTLGDHAHHHHDPPHHHHHHCADERDEAEKGAKSLKGTYIVRVGWDDVRGWLGEVSTALGLEADQRRS